MWRLPGEGALRERVRPKSLPYDLRRFHGVDGFATDRNLDGTFEILDTEGIDLKFNRPTDGSSREVAVLEFDTRLYSDRELTEAYIDVGITEFRASVGQSSVQMEVHAYSADGVITEADVTRKAEKVTTVVISKADTKSRRFRIDLNARRLKPLLAKSGLIGLRFTLARGSRMAIASRECGRLHPAPLLEFRFPKQP